MRLPSDSYWCFCNGGGGGAKSERIKASIFSGTGPAMATIAGGGLSGTGFLIHRNLLLTTHANLPSVAVAEGAQITLQNTATTLSPHRFFITSPVLDLTIVGLDAMGSHSSSQHPHHFKTFSKPDLDLGCVVYILGYTEKNELAVGEGKVAIATDSLIKLSTDGITWTPGSAGFDVHGTLAFMVCDPMKLATSPNTNSSTTSSSSPKSWSNDSPKQFGIPVPVICDWLSQHWEGSLDEPYKPKLQLKRLVATGQRSDHSSASFTMRRVFKSADAEFDKTLISYNVMSKTDDQQGPSFDVVEDTDETLVTNPEAATPVQDIPKPEIRESAKLDLAVSRRKESTQIQLLDINFPPKFTKGPMLLQTNRKLASSSDENCAKVIPLQKEVKEHEGKEDRLVGRRQNISPRDAETSSVGSVTGPHSDVQSSYSPIQVSEMQHRQYSSDEETTMHSAETAESRNYPSPGAGKFQQAGRSQSCMNHDRWRDVQKNSAARKTLVENERGFVRGRKVRSQGAASHRSGDYFGAATVALVVKERNNLKQLNRSQTNIVHPSQRWVV